MMNLPFAPRGLLFDLDGTLLDREGQIKSEIVQLFTQIRDRGIKVGIATGRQLFTIQRHVLPHFLPDDKHVISGGAEVITGREHEVIWGKYLASETVKNLFDRLSAHGAKVFFGQKDKGFINRLDWVNNPNLVGGVINNPYEVNLVDWSTPLVVVDFLTEGVETEMREMLKEGFDQKIAIKKMTHNAHLENGLYYYDITPQGINKSVGAKVWAESWGFGLDQVVAFGDNANDLDLLKAAGWGVVMRTGTSEALAVADEVVPPVDEGGIQDFLRLLLSK